MIPALGLGGLAKQVAQNCLLKQREGLKVVLEIAEKSGSLLNARSEKQIRDALSSHLGGEVNLTFVVANSAQLDTPAARAEQRADDARSEAVNVIQQDADFQSLVSTFDGSVVEGSIEPVTKPN
jgi:DNA polymerase-3 subunit gamma/tau